jgi:molybdate transport system regulatory protein
VKETGSIRTAAEQMHMSYMRAWTLIRTMNACFKEPVVEAVRGGKEGGGATLTKTGDEAILLYRDLEKTFHAAAEANWTRLQKLLRA